MLCIQLKLKKGADVRDIAPSTVFIQGVNENSKWRSS